MIYKTTKHIAKALSINLIPAQYAVPPKESAPSVCFRASAPEALSTKASQGGSTS